MQPRPPTALGSLAFFTNLGPLQPRRDLGHCGGSLEPHLQGWENADSCDEGSLLIGHLKRGSANPSGASEHTGSGTHLPTSDQGRKAGLSWMRVTLFLIDRSAFRALENPCLEFLSHLKVMAGTRAL